MILKQLEDGWLSVLTRLHENVEQIASTLQALNWPEIYRNLKHQIVTNSHVHIQARMTGDIIFG